MEVWNYDECSGERRIRSSITVTSEGSCAKLRKNERKEKLIVGVIALENYSRQWLHNKGNGSIVNQPWYSRRFHAALAFPADLVRFEKSCV